MDGHCTICNELKNQGNVCRLCRAPFIPFAAGEPLDCACENCDFYGFPCLNCAEYTFKGMLGKGHDEPIAVEDMIKEYDSMDIDTIQDIIDIKTV